MIHFISDRCPIYGNAGIYIQVNQRHLPIEMITCWIGCNHFRLDEEYKQKCEETEKFIEGMNKQWDETRAKNDQ
jgi:hypothetical protein